MQLVQDYSSRLQSDGVSVLGLTENEIQLTESHSIHFGEKHVMLCEATPHPVYHDSFDYRYYNLLPINYSSVAQLAMSVPFNRRVLCKNH